MYQDMYQDVRRVMHKGKTVIFSPVISARSPHRSAAGAVS
jgi:hypothetical protein